MKSLTKNHHLVSSGYYNRLIFYQFLSQARVQNPKNLISWAIVAAGAVYSRELGDTIQKRATYCGIPLSVKTMIKNIRHDSEKVEKTVMNVLSQQKYIVAAMDNNQKGYPKKYQRYGISNQFIKVTASFFKLYSSIPIDTPNPESTTIITYINHPIPSPFGMIPFENLITVTQLTEAITTIGKGCQKRDISTIDFTGKHVSSYIHLAHVCDIITNGIRPFMTGYNATQKYSNNGNFNQKITYLHSGNLLLKNLLQRRLSSLNTVLPFNSMLLKLRIIQ